MIMLNNYVLTFSCIFVGQNWAKHLGIHKAKVIKFSGMERIHEIIIDDTKVEEENVDELKIAE